MHVIKESEGGLVVFPKASYASGFWQRLKGLMFRSAIGKDEALIFKNAPFIHTCFMRFPIDVVFLDETLRVRKTVENLSPWKYTGSAGAAFTVECGSGTCRQKNIREGLILIIEPGGRRE